MTTTRSVKPTLEILEPAIQRAAKKWGMAGIIRSRYFYVATKRGEKQK